MTVDKGDTRLRRAYSPVVPAEASPTTRHSPRCAVEGVRQRRGLARARALVGAPGLTSEGELEFMGQAGQWCGEAAGHTDRNQCSGTRTRGTDTDTGARSPLSLHPPAVLHGGWTSHF